MKADHVEILRASLAEQYQLVRELGRGGMATVYLAEDLKHSRRVALKVLDAEVAHAIGPERFLREIATTARLTHPHILPLHDSGQTDGVLWYVMPYVEGESLRQRLEREKQLPVEQAVQIVRDVAGALDYAHGHGVVHRDIKPENILLQDDHALLMDFGIARAVHAAGGDTLTTTGVSIGTPIYMSPEQCAGSKDIDGRSDVYALACVLYEMLAGRPPFVGASAENLTYQHLNATPQPVTDLRPTVPAALAQSIHRALAKAPADRFATATELVAAIADPLEKPRRSLHPRRSLVWAGLSLLSFAAIAVWLATGPIERWRASHAATTKRAWVFVADFTGPPDDSSLAVATRDLVSAALDQSQIIATVPPEQISLALQHAGLAVDTKLTPRLARELSYRTAVRAVLEGRISRAGSGYSIVLRVTDVDSARTVVTASDVAKSQDDLIPAIGRLAKHIRRRLGENQRALAATRELMDVITPSFDAYRKVMAGVQAEAAGDYLNVYRLYREALVFDPDCAPAWLGLAVYYSNRGLEDSSRIAVNEMLRRPTRMTELDRLEAEAQRVGLTGDVGADLAIRRRILLLDSQRTASYLNIGTDLLWLGRYEEGLAAYREGERNGLWGAVPAVRGCQFWALVNLGRISEAAELVPSLGSVANSASIWVALAASNWHHADSMCTALLEDPEVDNNTRQDALRGLAASCAARGEFSRARQLLTRSHARLGDEPASLKENRLRTDLPLWMLEWVTGDTSGTDVGVAAAPEEDAEIVFDGLWQAKNGNLATGRARLDTLLARQRHRFLFLGQFPGLLEAALSARQDRWNDVIPLLRPVAMRGVELGIGRVGAGSTATRWLTGEAYEHLGRPDSAAVYYELLLRGIPNDDVVSRGILSAPAHQRLVMLYCRMGRINDARPHLGTLMATCSRPDPHMRALIDDARAAFANAQGMGRSAGR